MVVHRSSPTLVCFLSRLEVGSPLVDALVYLVPYRVRCGVLDAFEKVLKVLHVLAHNSINIVMFRPLMVALCRNSVRSNASDTQFMASVSMQPWSSLLEKILHASTSSSREQSRKGLGMLVILLFVLVFVCSEDYFRRGQLNLDVVTDMEIYRAIIS